MVWSGLDSWFEQTDERNGFWFSLIEFGFVSLIEFGLVCLIKFGLVSLIEFGLVWFAYSTDTQTNK